MLNLPPNKPIQHCTSLTTDIQLLPGRLHSPIAAALYPWSLAFHIKPARPRRLSSAIVVASQDTSKGTAGSIWQSNRQSGQATAVAKDMDRLVDKTCATQRWIRVLKSQKTDIGAVVGVRNLIEQKFADNSRGCAYGTSTLAC